MKPEIFLLDRFLRFHAALCHPDVTDTIDEEYIHRLITFPAIFKVQELTIQREVDGAEDSRVYGSGSVPPPESRGHASEPTMSEEGRSPTLLTFALNTRLTHLYILTVSSSLTRFKKKN